MQTLTLAASTDHRKREQGNERTKLTKAHRSNREPSMSTRTSNKVWSAFAYPKDDVIGDKIDELS